ncbi:MAG TPA: hypothetical protein VGC14_05240 [Rhizobium sp.]
MGLTREETASRRYRGRLSHRRPHCDKGLGKSVILATIRRANIAFAWPDRRAVGPHYSRHTLVIDEVTSPVKLMRHAAISIAGQLILDVLDNRSEFSIVKNQIFGCGSVVERASREIYHFAYPSDGAGRGPVSMKGPSLPPAIGWRGVF